MIPDSPLPVHQETLPGGLTLLFEPMPWLSSASLALLVPMGSTSDPEGQEGSASVHAAWAGKAAGGLDARAFSAAFDALGVRRGYGAERNYSTVSASLLAATLPEALPLISAQLRRPELSPGDFGNARQLALEELASLEDQPAARLGEALSAATFQSGHGRSAYGTAEGLARLDPASVKADRAARHGPHGSVLAVAGGCDWDDILNLAAEQFGDWHGNAVEQEAPVFSPPLRRHITADTAQVQIGLSYRALPPGHDDTILQSLATAVLSGGMGARLFTEVREKRGLVYAVGASGRAVPGAGWTVGYASTTPEKAGETLAVMEGEFSRLSSGVTEEELERARQGLLTRLVMQGEASGARTSMLASDWLLRGRVETTAEKADRLRAVDLGRLNAWLADNPLENPVTVTLGPGEEGAG